MGAVRKFWCLEVDDRVVGVNPWCLGTDYNGE